MVIIGALSMEKQVILATVELVLEGLKMNIYNALNVVLTSKPS